MKQSEYNRFRELCSNIETALADAYPDETPAVYEFAVNPDTYEVKVIDGFDETPDGWMYESIVDAEYPTIEECAKQYFDFRQ